MGRSADYLRQLLAPLGIYDLQAPFNGGELEAVGGALDGPLAQLEELEREMCLATAEGWGLERMAELFAQRPVAQGTQGMRQALAALGRIGGDSFTLEAINDTICGCGVDAKAVETGTPGLVQVIFPDVAGIPADFDRLSTIIQGILPAHVLAEYCFWYITWILLEDRICNWSYMEILNMTWTELETMVK